MKYFVFVLVLLTGYLNICAQNITKVEYNFDEFVKQGDGTIVPLPGDETELDSVFTLDVSSLEPGIHVVYLRTQNANGVWSLPTQQTFYIPETNLAETIVEVEYSIDEFVKQGDGTRISFTKNESVVDSIITLNIASLDAGIHNIYLRTKNDFGIWSLPVQGGFYVSKPDTAKIASVYYRFTGTDYEGDWMSVPVDPERKNVDSLFALSISDLSIDSNYTAEIYAKNNFGVRGFSVFTSTFTVMEDNAPVAAYDTLNFMVYTGDSLEVRLDTLFSDEDKVYGDTLIYCDSPISAKDISAFATYSDTNSLKFKPVVSDTGIYVFNVFGVDIPGKMDTIVFTLTVIASKEVSTESYSWAQPSISPNPNNGVFNIQLNTTTEDYTVSVYSLQGKQIGLFRNTNSIELNNVPDGVYIVNINIGSTVYRNKIIVGQ